MYEDVWAWAGKFRGVETNLGVSPHLIGIELRQFLGDALCWIQKEVYQPKEIAIRIKHRIVSIHCFPNGNGRHSRLFADLIMEKIYGKKYFSWGAADLVRTGNLRKKYIAALKEADNGQIDSLLKFALS